MKKYILALDQGTTSSRAVLVDQDGKIVGSAQQPFRQIYPHAGWVEHDPLEIWESQLWAAHEAIKRTGIDAKQIAGIGVANQRETVVLWHRTTGAPITNAIVWQCRRTSALCDELKRNGLTDIVRKKTGLFIDPYFSGAKIAWILQNVPGALDLAERGELLAGTIDTWLTWKLTKGQAHVTDPSNASRTMLYNIYERTWDQELMAELGIPRSLLPQVSSTSGYFGLTDLFGAEIPIYGIAGDQQAALFGQACFAPGMAKATYGTGAFLLMNTGDRAIDSKQGLLTTIAWEIDGRTQYAVEGSVFVAGALVQWLRDELGLIQTADETETLAKSVDDTGGVYIVPAFVGLGAPYWDGNARGAIVGLTRGSGKNVLARAALEAIAYQIKDVLTAMQEDAALQLSELRVDGGAAQNNFLMQFQADMLGVPLVRSSALESTALGAAYLAGLAAGVWPSLDDIAHRWSAERTFHQTMSVTDRERLYAGWKKAIQRVR